MARLKASEKYAKNPFAQQAIIHTVTGTRMIYSNPTGDSDRFAAVNKNTGENAGDLQFGRRVKVDKTHFLKFYAEGVRMFLGLKSPGIKVFMVIYQLLLDDPNYQQDKIDLTYSLLPKDVQDSISRTTYTRGVKELRNVNFLAPTMHDGVYWINIDYVFKGDRLTLVNQYILDGATKLTRKRMMQLPLRRTRMPQKGRPSRNRYRNTSDLSNGVQRANVSGNVPQQNLKRREAAFCWARRRFAPAKCRNALLLSSKSAKLSFSREKLLTTHYHEPTHISHQWTCESVSGSHLRERSDAGRTQHTRLIQTS